MTVAEALTRLGLEPTATPDDVRAAYRRLAKLAHSDRGGSDRLMLNLTEARDVVLQHLTRELVPMTQLVEALLLQERSRGEIGRRREGANRSHELKGELIRVATSPLKQHRRRQQFAAGAGVGAGAVALVARQFVPKSNVTEGTYLALQDVLGGVVIALGMLGALIALMSWITGMQILRLEHQMEDATDALADRATYLGLVNEIAAHGSPAPWDRPVLEASVSRWMHSGRTSGPDSVAHLSDLIGHDQFIKLFVAKGEELGLLSEDVIDLAGKPVLRYRLHTSPAR